MIRPEFRKVLEGQQMVLFLVWGGFVASLALYLLIPSFLPPASLSGEGEASPNPLRTVLWVVILVEVAFLFWWRQGSLTKEAILQAAQASGSVAVIQGFMRGAETPVEKGAVKILAVYLTKKIVAFAIAQSIAIYGLILALNGRHMADQYLLTLATALLLLYLFPSRSFFNELLREVEIRGGLQGEV